MVRGMEKSLLFKIISICCILSFLSVSIISCGGGGGGSGGEAVDSFEGIVNYEFFSDGSTSNIAKITLEDGSDYTLQGSVDESGIPQSIESIYFNYNVNGSNTSDDNETGTMLLDDSGLPSLIIADDGSRLQLDWSTPGELNFTYISSDGTNQVVSFINLDDVAQKSLMDNSKTSSLSDEVVEPYDSSSQEFDSLNNKSNIIKSVNSSASINSKTVSVTVDRCNIPVEDAVVVINYEPADVIAPTKHTAPASHIGDGKYEATIDTTDRLSPNDVGKACKKVNVLLSSACTFAGFAKGTEEGVCVAISGAIDFALGGPTGEGVAIYPVCTAALKSYNSYCIAHGSASTGSTSPADYICDNIADVYSVLPSPKEYPYRWKAKAYVEGDSKQTSYVSAPFNANVNLGIDFGGTPMITSFITSPTDPAPSANYTAIGSSSCTLGWTSSLKVAGSDGYTNSTSKTNSTDEETISLGVPGAEAGVSDGITFTVTPPSGVQATELSRKIGITF